MLKRTKVAKSDLVKVTFSLPVSDEKISVVGDFNAWTPGANTLVKRANKTASVSVSVPKGTVLHFRYLGEVSGWFDEPEADAVTAEGSFFTV